MEKARQVYDERKIGDKDHKFLIFFLNDDKDQSVHVEEVEEVDFFEVVQHLNLGGSIFITHRKKPRRKIISSKGYENLKKAWYFNRI